MRYLKVVNNIVVDAIIAPQSFIDSGAVGDPSQWIFSEHEGHIGMTYHPESDTFISPPTANTA